MTSKQKRLNHYVFIIGCLYSFLNACTNPKNNINSLHSDAKDTTMKVEYADTVKASTKLLEDTIENSNNSFPTIDYNKAIAYDYYCEGNDCNIVVAGKLVSTIRQKRTLTNEQAQNMLTVLSDSASFGGWEGDCFNPHLGIVFYKDKEIVAHVSICLECNNLQASSSIAYNDNRDQQGFSKSGRQSISVLCQQLKFSNCRI